MQEYKNAFKENCTECVWKMINDDTVRHEVFYRQTKSIELLWERFCQKLKDLGSLISYNDIYKDYVSKLEVIHREAVTN
tara:strand:- start:15344 stop:15580 length:237 start_codon:yes stop_codon:yes gene_type:complete